MNRYAEGWNTASNASRYADMPLKKFMVLPDEVQFITGMGRTDAAGLTERFTIATPFGRYSIEALDD